MTGQFLLVAIGFVYLTNNVQAIICSGEDECSSLPRDCKDWSDLGVSQSCVYPIYPDGDESSAIMVYCDMETDGGGWTVFQRRLDGSVNFYRGWADYVNGFGNLTGEHWLGLKILSQLTKQGSGSNTLRIELQDFENDVVHAEYSYFYIGSYPYTLHVSGYSGTAGDGLITDYFYGPPYYDWNLKSSTTHNGMSFATRDCDYDRSSRNCAKDYRGAWWFNDCMQSHLNGPYYSNGRNVPYLRGIYWKDWKKNYYSLKATEMKFRRN